MKVTFNINFHTVWGQKLCVVGSIPELGSWEPALAKEMSYKGDGNWQLELEVTSPVKDIEYRYFLSVNDKQIFEEWEKNHQVFFIGQADQYTLYDYWQPPSRPPDSCRRTACGTPQRPRRARPRSRPPAPP